CAGSGNGRPPGGNSLPAASRVGIGSPPLSTTSALVAAVPGTPACRAAACCVSAARTGEKPLPAPLCAVAGLAALAVSTAAPGSDMGEVSNMGTPDLRLSIQGGIAKSLPTQRHGLNDLLAQLALNHIELLRQQLQ